MWRLDETYDPSAGRVAAGRFGNSPDVILADGWPWSSYAWHLVRPLLPDQLTLCCYDMPGFAQPQLTPRCPASLDTQGEVFAEMLEHFGPEKPMVVDHDFDGATLLRAHLLYGCDITRYTLVNVVAMRPWGSEFFDLVGRHLEAFADLSDHIHDAVVYAFIDGALVTDLPQNERLRSDAPWLSSEGKAAFYAQFSHVEERFTAEVAPYFDNTHCQVSVLWGTEDPSIPLVRWRTPADTLHAPLHPMPGLRRVPQLEAPDRIANLIQCSLRGKT